MDKIKNYKDLLNATKKKAWKTNIEKAQLNAKNKNTKLMQKITKHKERTGISESLENLCENISKNETLASLFCDDPKRQNICEKLQIAYLNYLGFDTIKSGLRLKSTTYKIKSIDVEINKVYGMLKHTDEKRGAQDNQFTDLINFAKEMEKQKKEFVIVVSGAYYTEVKVDELKDFEDSIVIDLNKKGSEIVEELEYLRSRDVDNSYIKEYM